MFVGHYSTALLARRLEPRLPLGVLFVAVQLVDVFWALFVLAGVERVRLVPGITQTNPLFLHYMPFTHSLVPATLAWAALAAIAWRLLRPGGARAALVLGLAVASHWALDLPVHRPDLPLLWDCCKIGLGLWDRRLAALALELALLVASAAWAARRHGRPGRLLLLAAVLVVLQLVNVFGPAPTSVPALAASALGAYAAFSAAAWWADAPKAPAA